MKLLNCILFRKINARPFFQWIHINKTALWPSFEWRPAGFETLRQTIGWISPAALLETRCSTPLMFFIFLFHLLSSRWFPSVEGWFYWLANVNLIVVSSNSQLLPNYLFNVKPGFNEILLKIRHKTKLAESFLSFLAAVGKKPWN